MADGLKPNDKFHPFSNGTEFRAWYAHNCENCRSLCSNATSSRDGCPIEVALALASCGDGSITAKHGLRGGFLVPGANGLLVPPAEYPWRCAEYRGRDEPDDRPRHGPRPPAGQIDLLDPRNVPERVPAARP